MDRLESWKMNPEPQSNPLQDLDWLAFCYVSDELDVEARADFEMRLQDDQAAREAVACVVGECQMIDRACSLPSPRRAVGATTEATSSLWRVPAALLAAAAAIFILVAVNQPDSTPPIATASADELADAWASTLVSLEPDEFEEFVADEYQALGLDNDDDSWMFAALDDLTDEDELADPMDMDPMDLDGDMPCY